jgi:hypothetical protein
MSIPRRLVPIGVVASVVGTLLVACGITVILFARVVYNSGRSCTAYYGSMRFFGQYCGSLTDPGQWEYHSAGVTIGDDRDRRTHELYIWYHDLKFRDEKITEILKQPGWKEVPTREADEDIIIGAEVVSAWRSPSDSLLTIRKDGTMAFYGSHGDYVSLQIDERRIRFPVLKREVDAVLGPPDSLKTRATYR